MQPPFLSLDSVSSVDYGIASSSWSILGYNSKVFSLQSCNKLGNALNDFSTAFTINWDVSSQTMIPEDSVTSSYPNSDRSKTTKFWIAVCLQLVPMEKNCLYESMFPGQYAAIVLVTTTKKEQHLCTNLSPGSSCTTSRFGWRDSATVKILGGIHDGGLRCNNSSKIICTIHSTTAASEVQPPIKNSRNPLHCVAQFLFQFHAPSTLTQLLLT